MLTAKLSALGFLRPSRVRAYFVTGTGRCGTMLLARLLSLGRHTRCEHERSMVYAKLKPAWLTGDLGPVEEDIDAALAPLVSTSNRQGASYGECSGLLYLALPALWRRYDRRARFVLLTRRPAAFAESALARGFFSPQHPHALEHLRARPDTELGRRWEEASPLEKTLWYWNLVNGLVLDFFRGLPAGVWRIQPIESLDLDTCRALYAFLQLDGFDPAAVETLLATRINATPGAEGASAQANPWSQPYELGPVEDWSPREREAWDRWGVPLARELYSAEAAGGTGPQP